MFQGYVGDFLESYTVVVLFGPVFSLMQRSNKFLSKKKSGKL